jgi:hypothetical protein
LAALLGAFVVSVVVSKHSQRVSEPVFSRPPEPPSTQGVVGFPARADVLQNLMLARTRTLRQGLVGIEAIGVDPEGTLDLQRPGSVVRYQFQSEPGQGPVPERRAGSLAARHYCGRQTVELTLTGIGELKDVANASCERALPQLPAPGCGPKELWQLARTRGVKPEERATVRYFASAGTPAWRFQAETSGVEFTVAASDCASELGK